MKDNLAKLTEILNASEIDGFIFNPGPTLEYITGLNFHLMERPVILIIVKKCKPIIVLPELEKGKLSSLLFDYHCESYSDDQQSMQSALSNVAKMIDLNTRTLGVEPTQIRFLETDYLKSIFPKLKLLSANNSLQYLRISKNQEDLNKVRKAIQIAESALMETLKSVRIGCTEIEIAGELTFQMIKAGSSIDLPFPPIVASGPNSANPHAVPGNRKLQPGDMLIIDWGAKFAGYASDITRTFAIDKINEDFSNIHSIVKKANEAGRKSAGNGIPANKLDHAAREVIDNSGYGEFFIHRTGHGLGMEAHEAPYISSENEQILKPGYLFTIEPGIYIPNQGGIRIEDNVVITEEGSETLTTLPRELITLS